MTIYAHSVLGQSESCWERLDDHLFAVARSAAANAAGMGSETVAETAGWLHDLGKVKQGFQDKLHGHPNATSHSGEGARFASENISGEIGKLIAFCIAGHHSGLPNGLTRSHGRPATPLRERIEQSERLDLPDGIALPQLTAPAPFQRLSNGAYFELHFFTRMLFSTLVDADFIETEGFYFPSKRPANQSDLQVLRDALSNTLAAFPPPETQLNRLRAEVLTAAGECAALSPGFFSLTVPTGGGKTYSSLRFALEHALEHGMRRVIYVAPFTAIIEQTADVFRAALGAEDAVLEHHSAFDLNDIEDEDAAERMKLAAQNWDCPVIVTTAVQFFESLFANRTQKCRKLHNIARSVIILDEAQALPVNFLRPCLAALKELTRGYGCSVVLCTATQPAISDKDGLKVPEAIVKAHTREIAPDPDRLYDQLKRVNVQQVGTISNDELAQRVTGRKALVIVNNKRQARAVFDLLSKGDALHLSTNMTARHRQEVVEQI